MKYDVNDAMKKLEGVQFDRRGKRGRMKISFSLVIAVLIVVGSVAGNLCSVGPLEWYSGTPFCKIRSYLQGADDALAMVIACLFSIISFLVYLICRVKREQHSGWLKASFYYLGAAIVVFLGRAVAGLWAR